MSVRRLLVLALIAALAGGAAEQAAAKPPKHRTAAARKASAKKARQRAHAVKLDVGVAWVPLEALTGAPPLTGGIGASANPDGSGTTAPTTTADPTSDDSPPPATSDGPPPPSLQAVSVTLDDRTGYSARLSRASVTAGSVVVQLHNQGEDDHNLRVVPTDHAGAAVDFPLTGSGQNATKTLKLTAGSYRLFCTLTTPVNHESAGMNATLTVS